MQHIFNFSERGRKMMCYSCGHECFTIKSSTAKMSGCRQCSKTYAYESNELKGITRSCQPSKSECLKLQFRAREARKIVEQLGANTGTYVTVECCDKSLCNSGGQFDYSFLVLAALSIINRIVLA